MWSFSLLGIMVPSPFAQLKNLMYLQVFGDSRVVNIDWVIGKVVLTFIDLHWWQWSHHGLKTHGHNHNQVMVKTHGHTMV